MPTLITCFHWFHFYRKKNYSLFLQDILSPEISIHVIVTIKSRTIHQTLAADQSVIQLGAECIHGPI